jgi:hypothetical protein
MIEFYDSLLSGFGERLALRKGYSFSSSRFDIFGYCQNCRAKKDLIDFDALQSRLDDLQNKHNELANCLREIGELIVWTQSGRQESLVHLAEKLSYIQELSADLSDSSKIMQGLSKVIS